MKNIALLLALIIMLTGCTAPQAKTENSSDIQSSTENGSSEIPSEVPQTSETAKPNKDVSSMPSSLPQVSSEASTAPQSSTDAEHLGISTQVVESPNPAKQSWTSAYDSFYSGIKDTKVSEINILPKDVKIRENLVFPINEISTNKEYSNFLKSGSSVFTKPCLYGSVLENLDGSYYGEGTIHNDTSDAKYAVYSTTSFDVGDYKSRHSMTITEGLENQLLKGGFKPETTKAYSVICLATFGTLFEDGDLKAFYIQTDDNYGTMVDISLLGEYIENIKEPTVADQKANPVTAKPVVYLYPETELDVNVKINYTGEFTYTYPTYPEDGWDVTAYSDGRIVNKADESEHYYLFWEGDKEIEWDFTNGFIVPGRNTEEFLKEKLSLMGLTPREYNDFITYWTPELMQNDYNLITFATEQYEELAPMVVYPKPDTVLRVHMVYKKWDKKAQPIAQELVPIERNGFTVVEWGGTRA